MIAAVAPGVRSGPELVSVAHLCMKFYAPNAGADLRSMLYAAAMAELTTMATAGGPQPSEIALRRAIHQLRREMAELGGA